MLGLGRLGERIVEMMVGRTIEELYPRSARTPGEVVLFHACCHNPCGVSPTPEQWQAITDLAAERGFTPMIG